MVHSFRAFVFGVARNLCLNRQRSGRRAAAALAAEATVPPETAVPPELQLERNERLVALRAAVARLPATLAEVYELRGRGLAYDEIAAVLGIPSGTVKSRMNQLVTQLRDELRGEFS